MNHEEVEGVIRGNSIELEKPPAFPDGSRVKVCLKKKALSVEEKRSIADTLFKQGNLDPTFIAAIEEIVRDRKNHMPREIEFDATT